jgi:hypothetical protein
MEQHAGDVDPGVLLRAVPVDVLLVLGEREKAGRLARDILHAEDTVLGMPLEHGPVHALRSFWNAAAVLAKVESGLIANAFKDQVYQRFVDDISRLKSQAARRAFLDATAANRELTVFRSNGSHRLVLLPLGAAPTGRPLQRDEWGAVVWTSDAPDDPTSGVARRRRRLSRLIHEAHKQGTVATVELMAKVLNVGARTVQRDLQALRREGMVVPTRGGLDSY